MALLKNLRNRTGFTADEVATAAGGSRVRLAEIEREDDLDEAVAERLGDLYGVDIEALLGGTASVDDLQPVGALLGNDRGTGPTKSNAGRGRSPRGCWCHALTSWSCGTGKPGSPSTGAFAL